MGSAKPELEPADVQSLVKSASSTCVFAVWPLDEVRGPQKLPVHNPSRSGGWWHLWPQSRFCAGVLPLWPACPLKGRKEDS